MHLDKHKTYIYTLAWDSRWQSSVLKLSLLLLYCLYAEILLLAENLVAQNPSKQSHHPYLYSSGSCMSWSLQWLLTMSLILASKQILQSANHFWNICNLSIFDIPFSAKWQYGRDTIMHVTEQHNKNNWKCGMIIAMIHV